MPRIISPSRFRALIQPQNFQGSLQSCPLARAQTVHFVYLHLVIFWFQSSGSFTRHFMLKSLRRVSKTTKDQLGLPNFTIQCHVMALFGATLPESAQFDTPPSLLVLELMSTKSCFLVHRMGHVWDACQNCWHSFSKRS